VNVHFIGWSKQYDEWIPIGSGRFDMALPPPPRKGKGKKSKAKNVGGNASTSSSSHERPSKATRDLVDTVSALAATAEEFVEVRYCLACGALCLTHRLLSVCLLGSHLQQHRLLFGRTRNVWLNTHAAGCSSRVPARCGRRCAPARDRAGAAQAAQAINRAVEPRV
jgi:hypothetical protein